MSELQNALDYANQNRERFLNDLIDVLKIPSISTDAEFKGDVQRAAEWMANHLKGLGMEHVEVMPTEGGHPVVYADYIKNPGAPTVLVYGHYDVQPADPLELWQSGPARLLGYEGTDPCGIERDRVGDEEWRDACQFKVPFGRGRRDRF